MRTHDLHEHVREPKEVSQDTHMRAEAAKLKRAHAIHFSPAAIPSTTPTRVPTTGATHEGVEDVAAQGVFHVCR